MREETIWEKATGILLKGGVAVLPTDTIYGIHCLGANKESVERIYRIKGRDFNKPFIILLPGKDSLKDFGISINGKLPQLLDIYWPGPNSIILPVPDDHWIYLHRGTGSLAFRVPDFQPLLDLLRSTGPLVSTSANPSGKDPAGSVDEAGEYFHDQVDYYLDIGPLSNPPSNIYRIDGNNITKIR